MNHHHIERKLEKYEQTHPFLISLWKKYIEIKKKSYENSLLECSNVLLQIENITDKDIQTVIFFLYFQLLLKH